MKLRCSNLSRLCGGVLSLVAVGSVAAQESIIFSKPADGVTEKANAFMEQQPRKAPGGYNAPSGLFGGKAKADYDILPGAVRPQPLSPEQVRQMQKKFEEQRNWTLLTPEEIFGLKSAEQIMGLPDPDKNLTREQRYLKREELRRGVAATNGLLRAGAFGGPDENPFDPAAVNQRKKRTANGVDFQNEFGQVTRGVKLSPLEAEQQKRRAESPWGNAFDLPPPTPKVDKEQVAAMERFRALMEPSKPEKPLPVTTAFQPASARSMDIRSPGMQDYNPGGNSFERVRDSASRPVGVAPLPTVTGFTPSMGNTPQPKPKRLVESPPWVKNAKTAAKPSADPDTFPQRKF